jgi:hypothetical protein
MQTYKKNQFETLVTSATAALLKLPDDERAPLLAEMHTVVLRRTAETYSLLIGMRFANAFTNEVGRRVQQAEQDAEPVREAKLRATATVTTGRLGRVNRVRLSQQSRPIAQTRELPVRGLGYTTISQTAPRQWRR